MNCLEFRRAVFADPGSPSIAIARHAGRCPACRQFLEHTREQEAVVGRALRVAVPEGLEARILERTTARGRLRWLALAATVVVAVAIAGAIAWTRNDALALEGIEFVVFEEAQSIADAAPTDWKAVASIARAMGVSLPRELGEMRYVCVYPFAGGPAHHLLVKTPLGKVTLLLIPDRSLASRAAAGAHGLSAAAVPAARGAIIIISDSPRSLRRTEDLLQRRRG